MDGGESQFSTLNILIITSFPALLEIMLLIISFNNTRVFRLARNETNIFLLK